MKLDAKQLAEGMGITQARAAVWLPRLIPAFELAEITTPQRCADFLAQAGHESLSFLYTREIWGPTKQQLRYERDFSAPWPRSPAEAGIPAFKVNKLAYTLGNVHRGDGKLTMGRGLFQTTGVTNYVMTTEKLRALLGNDVPNFLVAPERLESPQWAAMSAALFWRVKKLNAYADSGDFLGETRRVNGGYNGLADRQMRRARLLRVLT